jgi:cellulose synthase/poly-beta-1,6-N-acetylglucosamine synthase-like glycosyltransferase
MAHDLRAVALEPIPSRIQAIDPEQPVPVAFTNPTPEAMALIESEVGRPIHAQVTDDETLDALLAAVYAKEDVVDVVGNLAAKLPHLSALETKLSRGQLGIMAALAVFAVVCIAISPFEAAIFFASLGTFCYVLYTVYRLYSAWKGWRLGSTINPSAEELAAMDGRELPSYTILLPAFREKPSTMRALFKSMADLDYPKHKLNGLLLLEADDGQTFDAIREIEASEPGLRPRWLKTLAIPPGEPRTKPKAMIYALLYSSGDLLTIFDAEDKPDPDQLKKAAWAFQNAGDRVACVQAKLSYYNSRQNLLTRWFTLEYAAWFDLFLPGLHAMKAPIPLGGTSNHFRLDILKSVLSWDPYNVTEDADLGLRFTRAGYRTQMLESPTYEEANSRYKNWLRQRSRWIKGYMQTFLVHTRHPIQLYRELGLVNCLHFMATVGGLIYTVVISPIFWSLLVLWLLFEPGWIPALFPGPVYYLAMASLAFGNFFFVFLALIGAVGRGQDDLSPYTLLFPIYWLMMSVAAYFALYELVVKPHYWQKTEHGLHAEEAAAPAEVDAAPGGEDFGRVA